MFKLPTVYPDRVSKLQYLISSSFFTDQQQQKTSVPQTDVNQQEDAKTNGPKNPGATHIRDLFLSFDKGTENTIYQVMRH